MTLLTGATGFVGGHVVRALRDAGEQVRCLVRDPGRAAELERLGCELVQGDMTEPDTLRGAVDGVESVVHLVAIRQGKRSQFEAVMSRGTRALLDAARDAGVRRFVHMSALGTTDETKDLVPYYRAKWDMEQAVQASGLPHVIFRPSFVFAPDGGILPTFRRLARLTPVTPIVGSGEQRLQPIWADDLALCFARALEDDGATNRTFELGGPDVVTWNELYERIAKVLGKRRALAHIPAGLASTGARATQWIPNAPLSADQVAMIEAGDNVVTNTDAVHTFQLPLVPLEDQIRRAA